MNYEVPMDPYSHRLITTALLLSLTLGCSDDATPTPDATPPMEDASIGDDASAMDASAMDASALGDSAMDASEADASMDAAFPISLVCERICSLLPACEPTMDGGSGDGGDVGPGAPDAAGEPTGAVEECLMGCEPDLADCSPDQLSALHACGDLMCMSLDEFVALMACVTAVECVEMEMMEPPSA
jgi:hypothetical protein